MLPSRFGFATCGWSRGRHFRPTSGFSEAELQVVESLRRDLRADTLDCMRVATDRVRDRSVRVVLSRRTRPVSVSVVAEEAEVVGAVCLDPALAEDWSTFQRRLVDSPPGVAAEGWVACACSSS